MKETDESDPFVCMSLFFLVCSSFLCLGVCVHVCVCVEAPPIGLRDCVIGLIFLRDCVKTILFLRDCVNRLACVMRENVEKCA